MQVTLSGRGLESFDPSSFVLGDDAEQQSVLHVKHLDLSHNSLPSITGLEGLTRLDTLNLSYNGLKGLDGGLPLSLSQLDASHNDLTSLQNGALLPLQQLQLLVISYNRLTDLHGVPDITHALRVVDASNNRLETLAGLERCQHLEELYVAHNLIKEVVDVAPIRALNKLRVLTLTGNPLVLRKKQVATLKQILPASLERDDLPMLGAMSSSSVNTSVQSSASGQQDHQPQRQPQRGPLSQMNSSVVSTSDTLNEINMSAGSHNVSNITVECLEATAIGKTAAAADSLLKSKEGGHSPYERRSLPQEPAPVPQLRPCSTTLFTEDACGGRPHASAMKKIMGPAAKLAGPSSSAPLHRGHGSESDALSRSSPPLPLSPEAAAVHPAEVAALHEALQRVTAERDAYRLHAQQLQRYADQLEEYLSKQSEATALVLRINDQIQTRMQFGKLGVGDNGNRSVGSSGSGSNRNINEVGKAYRKDAMADARSASADFSAFDSSMRRAATSAPSIPIENRVTPRGPPPLAPQRTRSNTGRSPSINHSLANTSTGTCNDGGVNSSHNSGHGAVAWSSCGALPSSSSPSDVATAHTEPLSQHKAEAAASPLSRRQVAAQLMARLRQKQQQHL